LTRPDRLTFIALIKSANLPMLVKRSDEGDGMHTLFLY